MPLATGAIIGLTLGRMMEHQPEDHPFERLYDGFILMAALLALVAWFFGDLPVWPCK